MALTAEERKTDLVNRLAAEGRARVGEALADSAEQFIRRYFALVAPDDIIYTSIETLLGGALSLWEFGATRQPGKAKVRIYNPTVEEHGWTLEHTVIEVINDDMPFLVDSVSAEINRRERNIHLLLHPVVRVRRDANGNRVEVTTTQAAPTNAVVESTMHVEIDQETDPAEIELLRSSIERILGEVRLSVADFKAMRAQLKTLVAELEGAKLPMPAEEVDEAREFLKWLDDGNFVFLGYRRYAFETRDNKDFLPAVPESGLGILREMRAESVKRSDVSPIAISERRASLTCVTAEGVEPSSPTLQISGGCVSALAAKKIREPAISSAGIAPPFHRIAGAPPRTPIL